MTNLCPTGPQSKNRQIVVNPKEMYFEANLIECNSDAKFLGIREMNEKFL